MYVASLLCLVIGREYHGNGIIYLPPTHSKLKLEMAPTLSEIYVDILTLQGLFLDRE